MTEEKLRYKYESKEAANKAAQAQRNQWNKENYEKSTIYLEKGMGARLKAAAEKEDTSKRAYIIDALKSALEKTEKQY